MAAANIIEMALIMMIECKYREQTQRETGEAVFVENMKILKAIIILLLQRGKHAKSTCNIFYRTLPLGT